jgi:hypothetical protein
MMGFESDFDAWFAEQLSPRRAGIGTLALAIAILSTAKSVYYWGFIASGEACL